MTNFEQLEISYKDAEAQQIDSQISGLAIAPGGAEFHFIAHSIPKLKLSRLGRFSELEFVEVKNMPRSFLEQASAWNFALMEACRQMNNIGWLAIRMRHDSDLIDIAMHYSFIPTVDDTGVEMIIRYFPAAVDSKDREKVLTSVSKQVMEGAFYFGTIQLKSSDGCKIDLANCAQGKLNPGLKVLAHRYEKMPMYGIHIKVETDPDTAPVPFVPYVGLTKMLQYVTKQDFETRLVSVFARNRFECMACLEAGWFPLASEVSNEGVFVRYY